MAEERLFVQNTIGGYFNFIDADLTGSGGVEDMNPDLTGMIFDDQLECILRAAVKIFL